MGPRGVLRAVHSAEIPFALVEAHRASFPNGELDAEAKHAENKFGARAPPRNS